MELAAPDSWIELLQYQRKCAQVVHDPIKPPRDISVGFVDVTAVRMPPQILAIELILLVDVTGHVAFALASHVRPCLFLETGYFRII